MTQTFVVFLTLYLNSAIYKKFLEKLNFIPSSSLVGYQQLFALFFSQYFFLSPFGRVYILIKKNQGFK